MEKPVTLRSVSFISVHMASLLGVYLWSPELMDNVLDLACHDVCREEGGVAVMTGHSRH